jgi:ferredoxin-type protein NapH
MAAHARPAWWRRNRWLLARRVVQGTVMGLFALGPWAGLWVARGTLASSEWLGVLNLTDPFVALQSLLAGHRLGAAALGGALLVAVFYTVFGGRSFCAWVCPLNPVTDAAAWVQRRWRLPTLLGAARPPRWLRALVLALVLLACGAWGAWGGIVWERVNPITWLQRALVFGLGSGCAAGLAVFVFDVLVLPRGWCGHVCPVGAFYGVLGRWSPLKVQATRRQDCTKCGDCFQVCPEPHVIAPALYGADKGLSPAIAHGDCIRCGRCIEQCEVNVFEFTLRPPGKPPSAKDRA